MKRNQLSFVTELILFKKEVTQQPNEADRDMKTLVVPLVVASAVFVQGFVKGGYGRPGPTGAITYVNRIIPDQVPVNQGSSTLPSVGLSLDGAHTVAGETVVHHVLYGGNPVPAVTTINGIPVNGVPYNGAAINGAAINGAHYNGGYAQVLHMQNGARQLNHGGVFIPASGADIFTQLFTPGGFPDNRHAHLISNQRFPERQELGRQMTEINLESRTRKPDVETQEGRLSRMATLASITSQMSAMDNPSTKTI